MTKHLLKVTDLQKEEIEKIVDRAIDMKKTNFRSDLLKEKNIALLFEKSSTRTRISFEVAIDHLGGNSLYLDAVTTQLSRGESLSDSAKVLNHYIDGVVVRLYKHGSAVELAKHSTTPVINGLTDLEHPCQAIADLMTIKESGKLKKGNIFAFYGDCAFNMANSLMVLMAMFGMEVRMVCPDKYAPGEEYLKLAKGFGNVKVIHDPIEGAKGADVIYTDTWTSMGMESEKAERLKLFMPYQVNKEIMDAARKDAIVMHCLPAYRGFEITSDVLDSKNSVVFEEAGNRLHSQKAILEHLFRK